MITTKGEQIDDMKEFAADNGYMIAVYKKEPASDLYFWQCDDINECDDLADNDRTIVRQNKAGNIDYSQQVLCVLSVKRIYMLVLHNTYNLPMLMKGA